MKTQFLILTAFVATLLFSCKKEDEPKPGIAYQLSTASRVSTLSGTQAGTITWTSGYAFSKQIEFKAQNASGQVQFQSETSKKIDLFSSVSLLGNLVVPQGVYSQVEFEIDLMPTATDAAFELKGTYNGKPVVFRVNSAFDLDADLANVTIADGKAYTAATSLNLANLAQGISAANLDAATKDASGAIVISASSNTSLYDIMIANLHNTEGVQFH